MRKMFKAQQFESQAMGLGDREVIYQCRCIIGVLLVSYERKTLHCT
jgi:hypothetical protein